MKSQLTIIFIIITTITLSILGFMLGGFELSNLQLETLETLAIVCGVSIAFCFVVGELTRNNSQMDKLWSLLPIIYGWVIAYQSQMNSRVVIMAVLVSIWGIRLTYNFAKKGAYSLKFWSGEEDYRWHVLRQDPKLKHPIAWGLFNLLFISAFQNILVLAITLPMLAVMDSKVALSFADLMIAMTLFGFIVLETIADKQQMAFQTTKYELLNQGLSLDELPIPFNLGFITTGLWRRSRHPNYFSEQSIWVVLYLFTISAEQVRYGFFHWTLIGSMFLILLFMGSSNFSESISAQKYPKYQDYMNQVSKYIPLKAFQD